MIENPGWALIHGVFRETREDVAHAENERDRQRERVRELERRVAELEKALRELDGSEVMLEERAACARIADSAPWADTDAVDTAKAIAAAIRARGART